MITVMIITSHKHQCTPSSVAVANLNYIYSNYDITTSHGTLHCSYKEVTTHLSTTMCECVATTCVKCENTPAL